jgi:hypothetical protein
MADLAAEVRPNLDELLQPYKDAIRTFKLFLEDLWQKSQLEESDFQNPLKLAKTHVDPQIWPLVSRYESVATDAADDDPALFSIEGEINQAIESLRLSLVLFARNVKKSFWDWVHECKDPKVTRALDLYRRRMNTRMRRAAEGGIKVSAWYLFFYTPRELHPNVINESLPANVSVLDEAAHESFFSLTSAELPALNFLL